jgi:hypothetical protein
MPQLVIQHLEPAHGDFVAALNDRGARNRWRQITPIEGRRDDRSIVFDLSVMQHPGFGLFGENAWTECPRHNPRGIAVVHRLAAYSRSRVSSIAVLPPLSTLTTLCTGLKPVSVISTT